MLSDSSEKDPNRATSSSNSSPPLVVSGSINQEGLVLTGSPNQASSRGPPPDRQCTACTDHFSPVDIFTPPCSHEYCRDCISTLVSWAIRNESRFPPRCCGQPIPVQPGNFFSQQLVDQFRAKEEETNTADRTYCSEPSCATFIPPTSVVNNLGRCPKCDRGTCALCKRPWHGGDCRRETPSPTLMEAAVKFGYRQCPKCQELVELRDGCYHITCICEAQFCYLCGKVWKTCPCNRYPRVPAPEPVRIDPIDYNDCEHQRWEEFGGPWRCNECLRIFPLYIYRCRGCHTFACRYCRHTWIRRR